MMTNEERAMREMAAQEKAMHDSLKQLEKILGPGAIFIGTVDEFLDDMCGSEKEEEKKAEDKENA